MINENLAKLKIAFADSLPKEFFAFVSANDSDVAKDLIAEALSFYMSHNNSAVPISIAPITKDIRTVNKTDDYSPFLSWVEKINLAIKHNGAPATTNEIVDYILDNEELDRKKVGIGVSVTLSRTKGKKFRQLTNSGRGFAYDIITHVENNNSPRPVENKIAKGYSDNNSDYNKNWGWKDKIKYFIDIKGGLATPSELNDLLTFNERIVDKKIKRKMIASMSSVLSQNVKPGGIFTKQVSQNGVSVYGIK